jgi:porin
MRLGDHVGTNKGQRAKLTGKGFRRLAALLLWLTVTTGANTQAAAAPPEPVGFWQDILQRPALLGDWGGLRTTFTDHGIDLKPSLTQFYQGLVGGDGDRSFQYGGKLDLFVNIDGEKLGLWPGLFITSHLAYRYGDTLLGTGGTLMSTNTALLFPESKGDVYAITSLVFTQFLSENFGVSIGKFNTVDLYQKPFTGGYGLDKFMNIAFTAPPLDARTFPPITLGAALTVLHEKEPVITAGVLNSTNTPTTSGFDELGKDGWTGFGTLTLPLKPFGRTGHYSIGGAYSSLKTAALAQNPFVFLPHLDIPLKQKEGVWTVNFTFDQYLYQKSSNPNIGWGLFGTVGSSDGNPSPIQLFAHGGIGGNSPIPTRERDNFGIGYYYVGVSNDLLKNLRGFVPIHDEQGVEIFYNLALTGWLRITADVQIIDPFLTRRDTATVFGMRGKIDF